MKKNKVRYARIPGSDKNWCVSTKGEVWTKENGEWEKVEPKRVKGTDYLYVSIRINGKKKGMLVHRVVLTAFVGPCPKGMEACHSPDRSRSNNNLSNLRWDTKVNNIKDRMRDNKGKKKALTEEWVIEWRRRFKEYAEEAGVHWLTVRNAIVGKSWRHLD